jgi:hypothetical protein
MRDIRNDLQDRVKFIEEQINAASVHFEKMIEQLQGERDGRVTELKAELLAIGKLLEAEQRRMSGAQLRPVAPQPPQLSQAPQLSLADFLVRKLSETGPLSKDDLRSLAVKEGYFADTESAARAMHATLMDILRSERIRQLPDGAFAPPTLTQAIRVRMAM